VGSIPTASTNFPSSASGETRHAGDPGVV